MPKLTLEPALAQAWKAPEIMAVTEAALNPLLLFGLSCRLIAGLGQTSGLPVSATVLTNAWASAAPNNNNPKHKDRMAPRFGFFNFVGLGEPKLFNGWLNDLVCGQKTPLRARMR